MKRALFAAAVGSFGLLGCQEAYTDVGQPVEEQSEFGTESEALIRDPENFNSLDSHLAALATAVLECKGRLAPEDFKVDEKRVLRRAFGPCVCPPFSRLPCDQAALDRTSKYIDQLLAIQDYDLLPERKFGNANAVPYFAGRWSRYIKLYGQLECPAWRRQQTLNAPTPENVRLYQDCIKQGGGSKCKAKSSHIWQVSIPKDCQVTGASPFACATQRAVQCSSWAGEQFIEGVSSTDSARVQTDPTWWKDPTDYPSFGMDSPYDYQTLGYEHRMAEWGLAPGDMWGAWERKGERCHKYNDVLSFVVGGYLEEVDCGGFPCMTTCLDCPVPTTPLDYNPCNLPVPVTP
jgi:hypothetical protein